VTVHVGVIGTLLVVLGLILLNGFFAMSEIAVLSSRRSRLRQLADIGHQGAEKALVLIGDSTRFLATVQTGITLVGILAGVYSGATLADPLASWLTQFPALAPVAGTVALAVVVAPISYLTLLAGELVPKRIALAHAETIAARVAPTMLALSLVAAPLVWFLRQSVNIVLRMLGESPQSRSRVTEEEVKALIAEAAEAGVLHTAEHQMITGVLRMAHRPVGKVMTRRTEVVALPIDASPELVQSEIARSGHSRFPVLSSSGEVAGIVHAKDVLELLTADAPFDLRNCLRTPLVVPASLTLLNLLERVRTSSVHLAIVVDDDQRICGVATPLDLLAGIVGELPPELLGDEPHQAHAPELEKGIGVASKIGTQ
jgi:putative hemolysin